ncbi:acyl carrier protein [Streptomyces camelliae]|uniref:acyl carrier protein n=1 Tax=Streptomyces camelliae TaxID=3004093 RepID=UPI003D184CDE
MNQNPGAAYGATWTGRSPTPHPGASQSRPGARAQDRDWTRRPDHRHHRVAAVGRSRRPPRTRPNKFQIPADHIAEDATSADIGPDSLAFVELALILEKNLDIKISDEELTDAPSLHGIAPLMKERSAMA